MVEEQGLEIALAEVMRTLNPGDANLSQIRTYKAPEGGRILTPLLPPAWSVTTLLELYSLHFATMRQKYKNWKTRDGRKNDGEGGWDMGHPQNLQTTLDFKL